MAKKKGGFKAPKHYEPNRGKKAGAKKGSRSPGHRGFIPEEERPKKARWSTEDRTSRGEYSPRGSRDERGGRSESDARRDDRGYRGGRDDRAVGGARAGRSASGARSDGRGGSGQYNKSDRYERNDRNDRSERRGSSGRNDRNDRTGRGDYEARSDRFDRAAKTRDHEGSAPRMRSFDDRGVERSSRGYGDQSDNRRENNFRDRSRDGRDGRRGSQDNRENRGGRNDRSDRGGRNDRSHRNDRSARGDRQDRPTERFIPEEDLVLERLKAVATVASDVEGVSFGDLGLGDNIVRALHDLGAPSPFPIQAATIPDVLAGKHVLGRGRTGSGKTIAFGAPIVERLLQLKAEGAFSNDPPRERPVRTPRGERSRRPRTIGRKPKALILAPTRELALQLDRTIQPIARSVGLFTTQIYGGVPQARQVEALNRGVDIVIGTAGRIEDLIEQGRLDLSEIVISVLDEADHMCDLGFLEPMQRILRRTAPGGQKLMFSATLDQGVAKLVSEFLADHVVHEVAGEDQDSGTIDHRVFIVPREDKMQVLAQLSDRAGKTLVFTRTRVYAEQVTEMLEDAGISAVALHGDLNQARRTRNLQRLTSGRVGVLVATDVAARGIHVDDIDLVVQADAPDDYKTYMHRSGRTGRAGNLGTVITLVPGNRQRRMRELLDRAEIKPSYFGNFFAGDKLVLDSDEAARV